MYVYVYVCIYIYIYNIHSALPGRWDSPSAPCTSAMRSPCGPFPTPISAHGNLLIDLMHVCP